MRRGTKEFYEIKASFEKSVRWYIQPSRLAEYTIYFFLMGERYGGPPKHYNCRCVMAKAPGAEQ